MMSDEEFNRYVEEGIAALPEWVRKELTNVAFLVREAPTKDQQADHSLSEDELLFGLYEGVPLAERGNEAMLYPDTITLFKKPILLTYERTEDIRACIENTIWHEVAHYFGHDEEWVAAEEVRRNKTI